MWISEGAYARIYVCLKAGERVLLLSERQRRVVRLEQKSRGRKGVRSGEGGEKSAKKAESEMMAVAPIWRCLRVY